MTRRAPWAARALLVLAAASVIVPMIVIVIAAVQPAGTLVAGISWPEEFTLATFSQAWTQGGFASLFRASAKVALVVVPTGVVFATMAGYALAARRRRADALLVALLLVGLTLPYEAIVVPLYYQFRQYGLLNTEWALILPLVGAFMPFGIFWMRAHFESIPEELAEAAATDGASEFQTFWKILLPTAWPAMTTLAVLYFVWSWNQFLLALILIQDVTKRTAPAGLGQFITQYGKDIPLLAAGTLIVIVPLVLFYLIFQRQLVRGLLAGSVK